MRRIRAVITLAILWGLSWALIGALIGVYQVNHRTSFIVDPPIRAGPFWTIVIFFAVNWARAGAVAGALFAIALSLAERNRSLAHLSLVRVAAWGVLGSLVLPGTLITLTVLRYNVDPWFILSSIAIAACVGGVSAAATLLIARAAPSHARDAAA